MQLCSTLFCPGILDFLFTYLIFREKVKKTTVTYKLVFSEAFSHFSLLEFADEIRIKMSVSGRGRGSSSSEFSGGLRNESGHRN